MSGIKSDKWITMMAEQHGLLEPFEPRQVRTVPCWPGAPDGATRDVISYGVSSYGYDIRVAEEFKVFTPTYCGFVDPKGLDPKAFQDVTDFVKEHGYAVIPPNSFALARSVEKFKIPHNVMTLCVGKSSYARVGIIVNVTPFEPGWRGWPTLEISNTTPLPAKIWANEGIAQVLFFEADERCAVTYEDRQGKYQDQPAEIVLPRA